MRTTNLFHSLICSILLLLSLSGSAAPRLRVVVVVEGMTDGNLQTLRSYWPVGGLRTLSEEAYQTTVGYDHEVYGGGESLATLMTGLNPSHHGYQMDTYFSRSDRRQHVLLEDKQEKGIGTKDCLSARGLIAMTLTDEHRIRYGEQTKIYAVGVHATQTILLAGHSADACCWLDAKSQQWVGSSYYSEGMSQAADEMNIGGRMAELSARQWVPRMAPSTYMRPTAEEKKRGFSYESSRVFPNCPISNTMVVELALAIQKSEHMGEDTTPDMLLLDLHTTTPNSSADAIMTAEQEDMYLWLNQDLGYLMEQLDKRIGKQNYELLLMGLPSRGMSSESIELAGLEVQGFNVDRAAALTGTYLMALYGHERWVDGGHAGSIYLNRALIEQKRLSLSDIQRQVANFMMEFEGVEIALPAHEAVLHDELRSSIGKRTMGDVIYRLEPNWVFTIGDKDRLDKVVDAKPSSPILLWSGSPRQWPKDELRATEVLPRLLR